MIRRYDLLATPFRRNDDHKLVVVLSSPHLLDIESAIVAPVYPQVVVPPDRTFNVGIVVHEELLTISIPLLASVSLRRLGRLRINLLPYADDIDRAVERPFNGF